MLLQRSGAGPLLGLAVVCGKLRRGLHLLLVLTIRRRVRSSPTQGRFCSSLSERSSGKVVRRMIHGAGISWRPALFPLSYRKNLMTGKDRQQEYSRLEGISNSIL